MGVAWIMTLGLGEEICFDRKPWWGASGGPERLLNMRWALLRATSQVIGRPNNFTAAKPPTPRK